jgi:hypothetical protein
MYPVPVPTTFRDVFALICSRPIGLTRGAGAPAPTTPL